MATVVPFNTGYQSAVSRSRPFFHYKVPLTFRYSWKRLRKRRTKNLIKFPQVYIAFVFQYVHCFEKNNTYWLNESWETRLPKRLKCTISVSSSIITLSGLRLKLRSLCLVLANALATTANPSLLLIFVYILSTFMFTKKQFCRILICWPFWRKSWVYIFDIRWTIRS